MSMPVVRALTESDFSFIILGKSRETDPTLIPRLARSPLCAMW